MAMRRCAAPLLGMLLATLQAFARQPTELSVGPGPAVISAEERALQPDPARGAEHAVILLEETDHEEDALRPSRTSYHLRAKILSAEGRSLADVEIPHSGEEIGGENV